MADAVAARPRDDGPTRVLRAVGWPALAAAIPSAIFCIVALSLPLTAAQAFGLSPAQATSWILALYGVPGVATLVLAARYRQPLLLAWNVPALAFIGSTAGHLRYEELLGASVLGGIAVLVLGALRATERAASWVPAPIVMAMLAGAILPYVARIFTAVQGDPVVAGLTFGVYLLGRALLSARISAIVPALLTGLAAAAATGQLDGRNLRWVAPVARFTAPAFSLEAIAMAVPLLVILVTMLSNVPSLVFMRSQGYEPPARVVDVASGTGTVVGSLFGPTPVCMAVLLVPLVAGPDAGPMARRHRAVSATALALILIAVTGGMAIELLRVVPSSLLLTVAGLSLIGVLIGTLQQVTRGPLTIGPVFAFVVAVSGFSFLGFGSLFWSLVLGVAVSLLLEPDQLRALRGRPAAVGGVEQRVAAGHSRA
jgi:benzoate membrane transport protein